MASSSASVEAMLSQVKQQLSRKASFEEGVKGLTTIVESRYSSALPEQQKELFGAVRKVGTLLQSRYTARGFWMAGLKLFSTTQAMVSNQLEKRQLRSFIDRAQEIMEEHPEREHGRPPSEGTALFQTEARGATPYLFEGQLSAGETPSRPAWLVAQSAHLSILNELHAGQLDHQEQANVQASGRASDAPGQEGETNRTRHRSRLEQLSRSNETRQGLGARVEARRTAVSGEVQRNGGDANLSQALSDAEQQVENAASQEERLRTLLAVSLDPSEESSTSEPEHQALPLGQLDSPDGYSDEASRERAHAALRRWRALVGGPGEGERIPTLFEVMQAAMSQAHHDDIPALQEALEASMQAGSQGPPPASKKAVSNLIRRMVTAEMLTQLESDTQCTVCRETFIEEVLVLEMPCNHWFHPDCILPWLAMHNSCPLCRFEMPTDDVEYERQKVRDMEERAERHGVENALRENEHMFM